MNLMNNQFEPGTAILAPFNCAQAAVWDMMKAAGLLISTLGATVLEGQ